MMRVLFWVLLLGNAILFAVMQRGGLSWGEPAYQPQPALHQEKIRLLAASPNAPVKALPGSATAMVPAGAPLPSAASAPVASPATAVNPAMAASQVTAAKPPLAAIKQHALPCLEWGDFSGADMKRATEVLSALRLGDKLSQRQIEYDKGYWVHFPPQKNLAAANRKVSQIKELGINEYFIVRGAGASRYAISLGVFKSQDAAQNYLDELRAKGVRTAQIGERAIKLKTTMFMLNEVDAATEATLTATMKDFPGGELKNVPCALTR